MASRLTYIQAKAVLQLHPRMINFAYFGRKLEPFCSSFLHNFNFHASLARFLSFQFNPFFVQLCYFLILSLFGYMGLKVSNPRSPVRLNDLDLFYTSVSASTVSSMSALEMEVFSNSQLIILTFLMLLGGEVFISFLQLVFTRFKYSTTLSMKQDSSFKANQIELGLVSVSHSENHKPNQVESFNDRERLKYNSLKCLSHVVLSYLIVVHFVGVGLVSLYILLIPSVRQVLEKKGIKLQTFSFFTIVSTFANCGFVPTNENMVVFKKNSGLLILLLPLVFLGNTLYPPCLRLVIKLLKKGTGREEFSYLLKNSKEMGYGHLLSGLHCWLLLVTVFGFNMVQFIMLCSMERNSKSMEGLNLYGKLVASLFQVTNTRHAGESVFDLSTVSSAILVLFIVMMYLPPYTTFLSVRDQENNAKREEKSIVECLVFSQISYLVIFIILICITERESLKEDPLNFNVLNITLEVISAYGNVGFSTGYSCARQLKPDAMCRDSWVGFSGRWSTKGKSILIFVMFFGRLKQFNMNGGKPWHQSKHIPNSTNASQT
ncbi:sodium transporter HKT1-like [Lotus japonicus]|uniref:sodium transporter HKT1-like n=1 Tax=Lotus japonicus TaxID=34305 RepID=UPI0025850E69|nr:sodium transporter HKT1-like [Lotus japonicus]